MSGLTIRRPAIERHEIDLRTPDRCRKVLPGGACLIEVSILFRPV